MNGENSIIDCGESNHKSGPSLKITHNMKIRRAKPLNFFRSASIFFELKGIMSGMKNAYELAMERLGGESAELSDGQKKALAEINSKMKAKVAETEIMFDQQLANETDPAKAAFIQQTRQAQAAKIKANAEEEKEDVRRNP
ncbi:hypothetical protein [Pontiella sulfatireligans]|nr:hypothetical protein [Pontiella sulfatireligans]